MIGVEENRNRDHSDTNENCNDLLAGSSKGNIDKFWDVNCERFGRTVRSDGLDCNNSRLSVYHGDRSDMEYFASQCYGNHFVTPDKIRRYNIQCSDIVEFENEQSVRDEDRLILRPVLGSVSDKNQGRTPSKSSAADGNPGQCIHLTPNFPLVKPYGGVDASLMKNDISSSVSNNNNLFNLVNHMGISRRPVIQNIVITVDLGVQIDLKSVAVRARNSEYNPKRFNGLIMRIRNPRSTALIFRTGKMVITGSKSPVLAKRSSRRFGKVLRKMGYSEAKCSNFTTHNIVASAHAGFPIDLLRFSGTHGKFVRYEPELFAGAFCRILKFPLVVLIFLNGKLVFTGAKNFGHVEEAFNSIVLLLAGFRWKNDF